MWWPLEDILDVVFGVEPRYRRRNLPNYRDPKIRPRLERGETGGYLWDKNAKTWVYDTEATLEDVARYSPGRY